MFATMLDQCGTMDILVSNAGLQKDARLEEMTLKDWNTVIGHQPHRPVPLRPRGGQGVQAPRRAARGLLRRRQDHQAGAGSADEGLAGATLLSEVGACGRRKLESGKGPAHQSLRPRGRQSSELVRSPRRVCRCHRCPASLPDASAGAELVIALEPPAPGPAALCAGAVLGVDPIVGDPHLEARVSRRAKPPAQPASALTHEHPDAAL